MNYPDIFTFADGRRMTGPAEWDERAAELRGQYEDCMYGKWRSGETVSYAISDEGAQMISFFGIIPAEGAKNLTVTVSVNGRSGSWSMPVFLPDASVEKPDGGYPVIISMHGLPSMEAALKRGYAVIPNNSTLVASDDIKHNGAFYDCYPYHEEAPETQTGVLMAWAWGASKILDALLAGAGEALGINPEFSIVTGVSRWGKATAVCGSFDPRFRLVAPACSGAGGLALYRYTSEGRTYDLSGVGASDAYTYGTNEPLSCLQSDSERGWFNEAFRAYASPEDIPVEQYELAALAAGADRCYFLIAACTGEDWVNAPSMWECYREADRLYSFLGLGDRFVCHFHKEGHAVLEEDFELMLPYFDLVIRGLPVSVDLAALKTSVYKGQEQ